MSTLGAAPLGSTGGAGLVSPIGAGGRAGSSPSPGPRRAFRRSGGGVRRAQMRDVEGLVDIGRGRQAVGRRGSRLRVGRGRWLADSARAGVGRAVIGQIQMDVIVVEHVCAWREDGREIPACARLRVMQEGALLAVRLLPVVDEVDFPPVGQCETGDIDRVAEGVFGEPRARDVVDGAATVGAEHVDGRDPLPESGLSVRLDDVIQPGLERGDHRAVDGQRLVDRNRAIGERRDFERTGHAADARTVNLGDGNHKIGRCDRSAGEAGIFGLRSPGRPLGAAEESAALQT